MFIVHVQVYGDEFEKTNEERFEPLYEQAENYLM